MVTVDGELIFEMKSVHCLVIFWLTGVSKTFSVNSREYHNNNYYQLMTDGFDFFIEL